MDTGRLALSEVKRHPCPSLPLNSASFLVPIEVTV